MKKYTSHAKPKGRDMKYLKAQFRCAKIHFRSSTNFCRGFGIELLPPNALAEFRRFHLNQLSCEQLSESDHTLLLRVRALSLPFLAKLLHWGKCLYF